MLKIPPWCFFIFHPPPPTQPPCPQHVPMYLLRTPPSNEAFKHSGGDSRLWTSATVTLYLDVELRRDSLPGTEQKTSLGFITAPTSSFWQGRLRGFFVMEIGPVNEDQKWQFQARDLFKSLTKSEGALDSNIACWAINCKQIFFFFF